MNIFDNQYYTTLTNTLPDVLNYAGEVSAAKPYVNTYVPPSVFQGQQPVYNLGRSVVDTFSFDKDNYGRGLVGKGALTGAKLGATIGLNPAALAATGGLSAIAVPYGAVVGGASGLFFRDRARKKAQEMQDKRLQGLMSAQKSFNAYNTEYNLSLIHI